MIGALRVKDEFQTINVSTKFRCDIRCNTSFKHLFLEWFGGFLTKFLEIEENVLNRAC